MYAKEANVIACINIHTVQLINLGIQKEAVCLNESVSLER